MSSGTTSENKSKHFVKSLSLYRSSALKTFEHFYGPIDNTPIFALVPKNENSSLSYMAQLLTQKSEHKKSGFYYNKEKELTIELQKLAINNTPCILLGISFALGDFIEKNTVSVPQATIIETGGMKGNRKEIIRAELHQILRRGYNVKKIHSEYGMAELLSQSYAKNNGIFVSPPWKRIYIRKILDPFSIESPNTVGGINIIDLANWYSCPFIETEDIGKIVNNKRHFEVLGRFDKSILRGCSLLID